MTRTYGFGRITESEQAVMMVSHLLRNTLILYDRRTIVDKIAYKDAKKAFFVYSSLEAWTRANSETSTWLLHPVLIDK